MRKLLSLLTALLLAGSMWATKYISYNGTTKDTETTISGSNVSSGTAGEVSWTGTSCTYGSSRVNIAANGSIAFSVSSDYVITKIVITSGSSAAYYGTWTSSPSGGTPASANVATLQGFSASSVTVTTSTAFRCTSASDIKIYYEAASGGVKAPTFTPTAGDFETSVTVTMASETDGAAIYYTTTESAKATPATSGDWIAYDSENKPSFTETTTIWAAAKKGDEWSSISPKTYTKIGPFTCNDVYSLSAGATASLNDVKVTYVNGKQVWIQDNSGALQLYLSANSTWDVADDLAGLKGTVALFNGAYQLQPSAAQATAVTATSGTDPVPVQFNAAPTSADQNKYVIFNNVLVSTATFTTSDNTTTATLTVGGETVTLLNNFKKAYQFSAGTHYNVVGIVNYNENATPEVRVYFVSAEEKECESKITITKADNPDHGTFTLNNSGEVCIEYGNASTTVTATPETHYHLATVTSTDGTVGDIDGNTCTITDIDANTTVSVTFAEDAHSTVTWNVNGATSTTEVYNGEKPVFPATPAAIDATSTTFYGWATEAWDGKLANLSEKTVYTKASDMPEVSGAVTYYAVFAKKSSEQQEVEHDYSFTIESKTWSAEGDQTLEEVTWALADNGGYYGYDGTKGQQVGSGSSPAYSMTLSTSGIDGTINSVKVYTSGGKDIIASVSVTVNDVAYLSGEATSESLTTTNTAYTFEGSQEGEIEISWTQDNSTSKAMYFKQVEVNYTTEEMVDTYSDFVTTTYAVNIVVEGSGTFVVKQGVSAITSGDKFVEGTEFTVEAEPADKYILSSIYAGASNITESKAFTLGTADITVTATFVADPSGVDNVETSSKAVKVLKNGMLLIEKSGRTYNAQGQIVK